MKEARYDYLIVGAGLYGAVFANEAKKAGHRVLVIDRREHIGGNIYTEEIEGIQVHRYGAHIFHTNNKAVWNYVNQYVEFNRFTNSPVANYHGELYSLPFNMYTFNKIWGVVTPEEAAAKIEEQKTAAGITEPRNLEEQAISLVGTDIYEKLMIKRITTIIGVILTIAILISLLMFVDMYSQQIELRNGGMMTLGFSQNRLAGVFYSANVGGLFALILAWCGLSTLLLRRGDERYYCRGIISVFQIVIALAYIAVSLSRGTYLAGIAFIFVFVLLCPSKRLAQLKIWKQMVLRAVCGLLMCIVSIGVVSALNTSMCRLMELRYQQKYAVESEYMDETGVEVSGEERTTDDTAEDDELQLQSGQSVVPNVGREGNNANFVSIQEEEYESAQHSDLEQVNVNEEKDAASSILQNAQMGFDGRQEAGREDIDITNKRASIWRAHIGLLTGKNLFVGVNDPSIYYEKQTNQGVEFTHEQLVFVEWASGNMHNGYIQVLVNCGVLAFGLLIGFLLLCFIKCVKFWMKSVNEKENDGNNRYMLFAVCVPLVVAILVDNVVETNFVMMGPSFFQALFWFVAGVCVYCVAKNQED